MSSKELSAKTFVENTNEEVRQKLLKPIMKSLTKEEKLAIYYKLNKELHDGRFSVLGKDHDYLIINTRYLYRVHNDNSFYHSLYKVDTTVNEDPTKDLSFQIVSVGKMTNTYLHETELFKHDCTEEGEFSEMEPNFVRYKD